MKRATTILLLLTLAITLSAKDYSIKSPSENIVIKISVEESINYSVLLNGTEIISPSAISMKISDGVVWGENAKVKKAKTISVSEDIIPVVKRKYAKIENNYNQLTLSFKGYLLQFRAYDEGAAYRWVSEKKGDYNIISEQVTFNFTANHKIWFPEEESMFTHQERAYLYENLSDINANRFGSTGMLVDADNGVKIYISESDLMDYPGMFLRGSDENRNALIGKFAGVVLEENQLNDRSVKPVKYADYIAECNGPRNFPWRAILITENDADLVQSELIYKLAPENKLTETDWIKPGKVAWDWWNANNIYGVDFESGVNNNEIMVSILMLSQD